MRNRNASRVVWTVLACLVAALAAHGERTTTIIKKDPPIKPPSSRPAGTPRGEAGANVERKSTTPTAAAPPRGSAYAMPANFYGAHLLVDNGKPGTRGYTQLQWARHLLGKWGYAKTMFSGVDAKTTGAKAGWVDYVEACYKLNLIPVIRLGGHWHEGQWQAPQADAPGDYHSMAAAVKRVVQDLPRSDMCPLYIEVWNEPNLALEWSGHPDPQQYADFFVQVAQAIRSINDPRIRIMNGGLATSFEWVEKLCQANPQFIKSFDVWASHPYPQNAPPSVNHHEHTAPVGSSHTLDAYLPELAVLHRYGRTDVKVILTETGYDLGNSTLASAGYPIIDEVNRAAYMVQACREYYPKWPELLAVIPFEFSNEGWERFDWVYPDSPSTPEGIPTKPHLQYSAVAALAKPTDSTGAVSGRVTVAKLGSPLDDARVVVRLQPNGSTSDALGNYGVGELPAGKRELIVSKSGFKTVEREITITAGTNTLANVEMVAEKTETLSGTVRSGDDGEPLTRTKLSLSPGKHEAGTDHKGRYEFKDCIPGRYTLRAESRGLLAYEAIVQIEPHGRNTVDFVLGRPSDERTRNYDHDASAASELMIRNPSFEVGPGGAGKAGIGLSFEPLTPYKDGTLFLSEREAHTGRFSQEVRMAPQLTAVRQITHYGTAKPGAVYKAGGWVRTDTSDPATTAWISLSITRNDGSVLIVAEPKKKIVGRSEKWVWMQVECTAPDGAERLSLNLNTLGERGSAFFDDLMLAVDAQKRR